MIKSWVITQGEEFLDYTVSSRQKKADDKKLLVCTVSAGQLEKTLTTFICGLKLRRFLTGKIKGCLEHRGGFSTEEKSWTSFFREGGLPCLLC